MFKILPLSHPLLKKKAKPVKKITKSTKALIGNMLAAMIYHRGLGIAAPQVGESLRIIIVCGVKSPPIVMINPEIVFTAGTFVTLEEGCLSDPGNYRNITRPSAVKVKFTALDKSKHELDFTGTLARAILHEVDHLEGVTYDQR